MYVMERSTSSVGTIKVRATSAPIFHSSNISDSILDRCGIYRNCVTAGRIEKPI